MKYYCKDISSELANRLHIAEQQKYESLIRIFNESFISKLTQLGLTVNFKLHRWVDATFKEHGKDYDGYTATFEAIIMQNGAILKAPNNDAEYVFFVNLTNICYIPLRKEYAVYLMDEINDFLKEVSFNLDDIETYMNASDKYN